MAALTFDNIWPYRVAFVDITTGRLTAEAYKALSKLGLAVNDTTNGFPFDDVIPDQGEAPTDDSRLPLRTAEPMQQLSLFKPDDVLALEMTFQGPTAPIQPDMFQSISTGVV